MPEAPLPIQSAIAPEPRPGRFVVFFVAGARWALPVQAVSEVQQIVAFPTLPLPDGALVGYLDMRGEVVPVVDARVLLGNEMSTLDASMHLVVVTDGLGRVALVVDEVCGVGDAVVPQGGSAPADARTRVGAFVRDDQGLMPIPELAALMAAGRGSAAA